MRLFTLALLAALPLSAHAAPDPRCAGGLKKAAQHFDRAQYASFVEACAADEVVALTSKLVSFRTVSSEKPAGQNPDIAAMGRFLRDWGRAHGMSFRSFGKDDVFELSWGEGEATLGLVFHGDVVPAPQDEWTRDPFKAEVVDGKLYGRGTEDDKGPLASALVAVAMADALGLRPQGRVLIIVGNGEESDWTGMTAYAQKAAPKMKHVISTDSGFPVVAAQSGFVSWHLEADVGEAASASGPGLLPVNAGAGQFLTQVPGRATLSLSPRGMTKREAKAAIDAAVAALRKDRPELRAEVTVEEDGILEIVVHGRAVHSSGADSGHNALWDLAAIATRLPLRANGITHVLRTVAERFDGDHYGKRLGLHYADDFMGPLLVAPTVLRVENGKVRLSVNMRRPLGRTQDEFARTLDAAAESIAQATDGKVNEGAGRYVGNPHAADTSGPLVQTLLSIYGRHTGKTDAKAESIRGGTYARLFDKAVDFGPAFPDAPYTGHAPDEYITVENLALVTRMLADAVHALAIAPAANE